MSYLFLEKSELSPVMDQGEDNEQEKDRESDNQRGANT
jgi:hypothetical protein